ncbi:hypothetical protein LY78DRAFT_440845 [Colletotrichum sublineola]|nr:hypothetical protein LY78DRAFT_440845 [Colletotrichum sublineola]
MPSISNRYRTICSATRSRAETSPLGSEHRGKALGFMRSYERLIRYPSDFELAKEAHLIMSCSIPSRGEKTSPTELTYADFAAFIRSFSNISDAEVSPRWHFGQLRLSRLAALG